MDKWKSINAAAKNEPQVILGFVDLRKRPRTPREPSWVWQGWFDQENGQWWKAGEHVTDAHSEPIYPTHWQPLPEPPQP